MNGQAKRTGVRARIAVLAMMLTLVLSGCVRMEINFVLKEDETADGSMVIALSDEVLQLLGDSQAVWDQVESELPDIPIGIDSDRYAEDGYTGVRYSFQRLPMTQVKVNENGIQLAVTKDGDDYVFTGKLTIADSSGQGGQIGDLIQQQAEISVNVTFPGKVISHNGELNGNTVTWRTTPGTDIELEARGSATFDPSLPEDQNSPASSLLMWLLVAAATLLLIAAIIAFVLVRRRRRRASVVGPPQGVVPPEYVYGNNPPTYYGPPSSEH